MGRRFQQVQCSKEGKQLVPEGLWAQGAELCKR